MNIITQSKIIDVVDYNPLTGILVWKETVNPRAKEGSEVGCKYGRGYRQFRFKGKSYQSSRIAWLIFYGELPKEQIDHINGVRDDNRIKNLREVSNSENQKNKRLRSTNTSGVNGVSWDKVNKKWLSQIQTDGESINLGRFKDKKDAIKARESANLKYGFHKNHGLL